MRRWWLAFAFLTALGYAAAATPTTTVREAMDLVRAGLRARQSDGSVAKSIRKLKLSERLDDEVIEALEAEGAGPKTAAELTQLKDDSDELELPTGTLPIEHPSAPSNEERSSALAEARVNALNYAKSLPDFICEEIVKRNENVTGYWRLRDELQLKLTFFQQKEEYKLISVNGRARNTSFEEVGGATSQGEFGSLLRLVFDPGSAATFHWDHWSTLRKRPVHVYSFRVTAAKSRYRVDFQYGLRGRRVTALVGQAGWVYVDQETRSILRIVAEAVEIPEDFPIQKSSTTVDYDFTKVGHGDYLLPLRAYVKMDGPMRTRNEVLFRGYRKFGAETSITFGQ